MRQAARAYFETQVTTTSQGELLIMLYDGAIKFLNRAKDLIDAKDYAGKGKLISSAIDVINELASSLNAEKGGELVANLNQLYFYCNKRLFMANSKMDKTAIDEVIKILGGLRSAYAQIIDTPEAQAAMAQATPPTAHPMRSPLGVTSAPAGVPIPTAKAHTAYANQGATVRDTRLDAPDRAAPDTGQAAEPAPEPTSLEAMPTAEAVPESPAPVQENAPAPLPPLDMPETLPGTLSPHKRLAASSLYRKFAP